MQKTSNNKREKAIGAEAVAGTVDATGAMAVVIRKFPAWFVGVVAG